MGANVPCHSAGKWICASRTWLVTSLAGSCRSAEPQMISLTLMLLRRAWHLRNDSFHGKGNSSVDGSVQFLQNYAEKLLLIRQKNKWFKGQSRQLSTMTSRTHPKPESSRGSKKINTLEGAANRMGKDQRWWCIHGISLELWRPSPAIVVEIHSAMQGCGGSGNPGVLRRPKNAGRIGNGLCNGSNKAD